MFLITLVIDTVNVIRDGIDEVCRLITGPEEKK